MKTQEANEPPRRGADAPMPGPRAGVPRPRGEAVPRPRFEVVLRGYDRTAVDAYVDGRAGEWQSLRHELDNSERRRQQAEQHAASTERENRTLRAAPSAPSAPAPVEDGFGLRVEKLMRVAEQEAADMRGGAAREASALLDRARGQAEQHRHEVEQNLIARATVLDQQAARRTAELQEREQQLGEQIAAARAEAQAVREAAEQAAEQRRAQAEADADAVRSRAAQEAHRMVEQARLEADRLVAVQGGARADLVRIAGLLATELDGLDGTRRDARRAPAGDAVDAPVDAPVDGAVDAPSGASDEPADRSPVPAAAGR